MSVKKPVFNKKPTEPTPRIQSVQDRITYLEEGIKRFKKICDELAVLDYGADMALTYISEAGCPSYTHHAKMIKGQLWATRCRCSDALAGLQNEQRQMLEVGMAAYLRDKKEREKEKELAR